MNAKKTTIALYANGKGVAPADSETKPVELRFDQVTTPYGTVRYFAPAK